MQKFLILIMVFAFGGNLYAQIQSNKVDSEQESIYINETIVELKIKLDDALIKIDELKAKIKLLEDQKTKASSLEDENQLMREEINRLKEQNEQLIKELKDKQRIIENLEGKLGDTEAEIDKLNDGRDSLLEDQNKKIIELESKIENFKDEIQRLKKVFSLNLKERLIENGFENISVVLKDHSIILTYENRIYRSEIAAIEKIMGIISPLSSEYDEIILIPQNKGIPLSMVAVLPDNHINASINTDETWEETKATQKINSSSFKFDVVVYPQFKVRLNNDGDMVKSQINLAPMVNTTLWKGMSLSGQLIIPIKNALGVEEGYWRPGLIVANQTIRLPYSIFLSTTAGYFTERRYGLNLEAREYFGNGKFFVGTDIGYTGYAYYLKGVWDYSDIGLLTWLFNAGFRLPKYNLSIVTAYGKFLRGDKGVRLDISQQFGEVDIGFLAINTDLGKDVGFNVRIPIYPSRYLLAKRFRISPAKSFRLEHLYKGFPRNAIQYETGYNIDEFVKKLNPDYIENQINQK